MPEIKRRSLPRAVFSHPLDRIQLREISADQFTLRAEWLDENPIVPEGSWFKRFPEMIRFAEKEN